MAQREIAYECPGFVIFEGKSGREGYADGDKIAITFESKNHGTLHHFYTLGSVVNFAIENCKCPFEAVEKAKERGSNLHWASQNGVTISSGRSAQKVAFMQKHGDVIKFHGKKFEIVKTSNGNIALKAV